MNAQPTSRLVGPVSGICFGIVFFILGANSLHSGIVGVLTDKTYTLGKGVHDLVLKNDSPYAFWFWIVFRFIITSICFFAAVMVPFRGFKQKRR